MHTTWTLKGNCHQKFSLSYLVVLWLLITMVLFVFLCDDWKWVKTWKEGAQNCPEVPSDVTPDLTSTRTFIVKNEVQPVCWSIEPTVRCTVRTGARLPFELGHSMCTLYTMRTPKFGKKGQNKQKLTAVCRTGTSSTKLQLFVLLILWLRRSRRMFVCC